MAKPRAEKSASDASAVRAKSLTSQAARSRARNDGRQLIRQTLIRSMLASTRLGLTVREVHDRLEEDCHRRTVRRSLEQLAALGYARTTESGRWVIAGKAQSPGGVPIAQEEAIALLVAEQRLAPLGEAWLGGAIKTLRAKALANMNEVGREFCLDAARMIVANPRSCVLYADRANLLDKLEQACHDTERVRITHRSQGRPARERTIEPRRLLFRDGALYVIARDVEDGQHKKFALHRIEDAEVLDESFAPDPSFDPDGYADASFGLHHGEPVRAIVEFDETVAHLFQERQFHPSQRLEPISAGIRVIWEVAGSTDLVRWLAGFGGHARVIEPARLRNELRALHLRGLES